MKSQEITGLWLGLLGVVIFALTLPMTRLAVGTPDAPQMSGAFIAVGRAVVAAGLSAILLLATAAVLRSGAGGLSIQPADALLLAAMACAAIGYGHGARLSQHMRAEHVICWALVLALPITLPWAWVTRPQTALQDSAWWGFGYVAVFSMWLGFFAWYRGLALGGTVRVSQVQLLQPVLGMLFAVPLLGERLDALTLGFAVAVIATVFVGKRMPVRAARARQQPTV